MNPLTSDLQLISRALDGLSVRHRVTASNIANQSVPGYKRMEVSFEDQLERAAHGGVFKPRVTPDQSVGDASGNNVEPAIEVGALTRIELAYQTLTRVLSMKASLTRAAITGR